MKGIIKYVRNHKYSEHKHPVIVAEHKVNAGDTVIDKDGVLCVVNQSTCVFFTEQVMRVANISWGVKEGEEVTLCWDCKFGEQCMYPFCKGNCRIETPRVREYEKRHY